MRALRASLLLTWAAWPAAASALAQSGAPRVIYIGAESSSRQSLLERWCPVAPARLNGPAYAVGDQPARDFAALGKAELGPTSVVFLDADAAGGMGETQAAALVQYVKAGGKLIVEGCDAYLGSLAAVLPVERAPSPVRVADPVQAPEASHAALVGVPFAAWRLDGLEIGSRVGPAGRALLMAGPAPLLSIRTIGQGKVAATPLTHLRGRYSWAQTPGYDSLLTLLVLALGQAPDELLLRESWAGACRYWMYAGFAAGYHKYRFGASGPAVEAYDEAEGRLTAARAALEHGDWPACRTAIQSAVAAAQKAAAASAALAGALTTADANAASERRDLLRLPGTLDVVHGMNVSQGSLGSVGLWYPATGRALLEERPRLDLPPGAAVSFWRGLHPYLLASGDLPSESDADRLWQRRADGSRIDGPNREIWLNPAVKALQAQTYADAYDGALVNETGGAEWNTYGTEPGADSSEFAQQAFRVYLEERGLSPADLGAKAWEEITPPKEWAAGRLYYEWQGFRSLYESERLKTNLWSLKLRAPRAVAALQPGSLDDPWRGSVGPESARYVDLLCPEIMRGMDAGTDPLDVELACRELWSLTDDDGDGAPDQAPGFAARFAWGDPLALSPAAHRSAASVALLLGASGIMEGRAGDGRGGDAAATRPEEVFLRWQAAFEPSLRHEDVLLGSRPTPAVVGVWSSWQSAAMAQGAGRPGGPDTWALSQAREWSALVDRAGFTSRLLYDHQVEAGSFLGVSCVVVPSTLCVSEAARAKLEAFARQGGTLILGCGAGAFDAYHQPREQGPGALGAVSPGRAVEGKDRVRGQAAARLVKEIGGPTLTLGEVSQPLTATGEVEVLATVGGAPLVCLRHVGQGAVLYYGATVWAGDGASQMLVQKTLESLGLRRPAYAETAAGWWAWQARVLTMKRARGFLVGVAHYQPYSQQQPLPNLTVRVRLPQGRYTVNRLSDASPYVRNDARRQRVDSAFAGGALTFRTDLQPCDVQLFLVDAD